MNILADNTFQQVFSKAWDEWKAKIDNKLELLYQSTSNGAVPQQNVAGSSNASGCQGTATTTTPFQYNSILGSTASGFGAPTTTPFGSTGSGFGFPATASSSMFGSTASGFGGSATTPSTGVFGSTNPANVTTGAIFGSSTKSNFVPCGLLEQLAKKSKNGKTSRQRGNVFGDGNSFSNIQSATTSNDKQKGVFGDGATFSTAKGTEKLPHDSSKENSAEQVQYSSNICSLFNSARYEECIKCIEYINNFWESKIYVKYLIKSYVAINDIRSAKSVIDMHIKKQKTEESKDEVKVWSNSLLGEIKNQQLSLVEKFSLADLKSRNARFSSISDKINLSYSEKNGYGMIAIGKIEVGEVILYEEPYASAGRAKCGHCFLDTFLRTVCNTCQRLYYCTKQCKEDDKKTHKWICPFLKKDIITNSTTTLALKVFLNGLLMDFIDTLKEIQVLEPPNNFSNFLLLSDVFKDQSDLLNKLAKDSCFLTSYIINEPDLFAYVITLLSELELATAQVIQLIGQILLRLLVVCENKSFIIFDDVLETTYELFPFLGFLQNNCKPNTIICRVENKIALKALKDIKLGENVTCSYFEMMNKTYRQTLFDNVSLQLLIERCSYTCHCLRELHLPLDHTNIHIGASNNGEISEGLFVAQLQEKISEIKKCLSNKNVWNTEVVFKIIKEIDLDTDHLIYQLICFEMIELQLYSEKLNDLEQHFPIIMNVDNVQFFKKNHIGLYLILKQKVSVFLFKDYSESLLTALISYMDFLKWFVKTSYPNQVMLNDVEKMYIFYRRLAVHTNDNGLMNALEA